MIEDMENKDILDKVRMKGMNQGVWLEVQERLAFCSWCCCCGGCNLCADISKYNIKGLKIYGG